MKSRDDVEERQDSPAKDESAYSPARTNQRQKQAQQSGSCDRPSRHSINEKKPSAQGIPIGGVKASQRTQNSTQLSQSVQAPSAMKCEALDDFE
jgi:hypothetical protein